jgi:cellulose synthase operon protein C
VCLLALVADSAPVWIDTTVRFGPFGLIPDFAQGEREAWLLPEGEYELEKVKTPAHTAHKPKTVSLQVELLADGTLRGHGSEAYFGFEAAELAQNLEALNEEQKDQALQSALSRYFGGADLSHLKLEAPREVGASVVVSYDFVAPKFASKQGQQLIGGALTFPYLLSRRFITSATRKTPLFIRNTEVALATVSLTLPTGMRLKNSETASTVRGPFSTYTRSEIQAGPSLNVVESLEIQSGRIAPNEYGAFAQFAGDVDLLQQRELVFE